MNLVEYTSGPFNVPFAIAANLANVAAGAGNVPYEGPWVPFGFAKQATVEITAPGGGTGAAVTIYGSNNPSPTNTYTLTLGGTITTNDVINLVMTTGVQPSFTVPYTVVAGDTTTTILAGHIAAAINASSGAQAAGISAVGGAGTITVNWPSISPVGINQANTLTISYTQGGNTETIARTLGTDGVSITTTLATATPGPLTVTPLPVRWIKARVTALSTGVCNVNIQGST